MIALLLCGLIAGACAAPKFEFLFGPPQRPLPFLPNYHIRPHPYVNENVFDTRRFWPDLSKELKDFDDILTDFSRQFPTSVFKEGVEGNEYKITVSLPDFEEKDIVVKAREGLLTIQATRMCTVGSTKNYLDVRTLPDTVNVPGKWIFEKGILKITFPLKDGAAVKPMTEPISTTPQQQTDIDTTVRPYFAGSREEIDTNANEGVQDVDIGVARGDLDKEQEVKTNEVPDANTVEVTTYAVDPKGEVEFVPFRH